MDGLAALVQQALRADPFQADGVVRLTSAQLATLLEGLPWHRLQPRPVRRPSTAW
jgi:hypothetical protein